MRLRYLALPACVFMATFFPTSAHAQEPQVVTKTACISAFSFGDEEAAKDELVADAKRLIVNELFGELISASTVVDNMAVTSEQIRATSLGFLRTQGNPLYANGEDFAEVCVTLTGYVTAADLELFEPTLLNNRLCASDPDLPASALREATRTEAALQALYAYEPQLLAGAPESVLTLLKRVDYAGSNFLPDSDIFCAEVVGEVYPIEVMALLEANVAPVPASDGEAAALPSPVIPSSFVTVIDERLGYSLAVPPRWAQLDLRSTETRNAAKTMLGSATSQQLDDFLNSEAADEMGVLYVSDLSAALFGRMPTVLNVSVGQAGGLTLEQIQTELVAKLNANLEMIGEPSVQEADACTVNTLPAVCATVALDLDIGGMRSDVIAQITALLYGDRIYVLTLATGADSLAEHADEFDQIIATFRPE